MAMRTMSKKNYEAAAGLIQVFDNTLVEFNAQPVIDVFCTFFANDSDRFNADRFRAACVPGANVTARPKQVGSKGDK